MRFLFPFVLLAFSCSRLCAESIDSLFARIPQRVLPLIELNPRLDMLDLYNYDMKATGETIFGGHAVMQLKTDNHIQLQLTEVSTWELQRLHTSSGEEVYACVHTLTAPIAQSRLTFYDANWAERSDIAIPTLEMADFWTAAETLTALRRAELQRKIDPRAIAIHWDEAESGEAPHLSLTLSVANLNREDRTDAEKCLKVRRYVWNGHGFNEEKPAQN